MKYKTQIESVEAQLKKIAICLDSNIAKTSFILSKLNLSYLTEDIIQRDSIYSPEALIKLKLYKLLKGIRSYKNLSKDLEPDEMNLINLGLQSMPTKQTFNYFLRTKLDKDINEAIELISEKVISFCQQNQIILDINLVKKNIKNFKNKAREEEKITKEALKLIKKFVYPNIDLKIRGNSKFTTQDILDILTHISREHDFANNGCRTYDGLHSPDGDTFLYHIKKVGSREDIKETFEKITNVILSFAKKNYKGFNQKLDIAYDIHKIPFYGKNAEYIKDSKNERGTNHFYQFLTCDIVVAGKRFTMDVVPVSVFDSVGDLLDESIKRVKSKIKVNRVYLDRGFANSLCVKVLRRNHLNYLMPMPKNKKVQQWMDKAEGSSYRLIKDYMLKDEPVNLYLVNDEDGVKRCFISNIEIADHLSHLLFNWYGKRWGIETGYRLKAQDFKPRTTSKNFNLRLFYFLFSTMLYNLWVLTNIVVGVKLYGMIPKKPLISTKRFSSILYKVKVEFWDSGG